MLYILVLCQTFYHLPEESGHLSAVLQNSPDEERSPGVEAALVLIRAIFTQQPTDTLRKRQKERPKYIISQQLRFKKETKGVLIQTIDKNKQKKQSVPSQLSF